ncbi:MAG TPA: hypothetical protein VGN94_05400, partial [Methylobacterium sp.]|nr:hypothetical protein [Methylobacterium sp.]
EPPILHRSLPPFNLPQRTDFMDILTEGIAAKPIAGGSDPTMPDQGSETAPRARAGRPARRNHLGARAGDAGPGRNDRLRREAAA